jgi:hypothetical protein
MISKIKTLGLALLAFAALGAMAASAAQAGSLDVGAQPSVLTAEDTSNHVFTQQATDGSKTTVTCKLAKFEGTLPQSVGQQNIKEGTVTPTYTECTFAGFFSAQVLMNGCKYTITGESSGSSPALTAWADVVGCTAGKHIEIRVAGGICTLTVDEANTLGHIQFENMQDPTTLKKDTTAIANVTGIETTQDGSSCPDGDNHHAVDSGYTGTTTVKAFQDAATDQVTKHGHQYTEHTCGTQVDLTAT